MKTIQLPFRLKRPVLACGADTKGAFALARGDKAYLEDGFGDLADPGNLERYEKAVRALIRKLGVRPAVVIRDLHPGYFSAAFAGTISPRGARHTLYGVQHHEAHIAGVVAENAVKRDVVGVALDGAGFGTDGCIWGGEFFVGNPERFKRAAHLEYVPMPGGDAAVREPWRMAVSFLYSTFGAGFPKKFSDRNKALFIKTMIDKGINSPRTSSAGRLFDAVASIVLRKETAGFEAELPMALEKMAPAGYEERYPFDILKRSGCLVISAKKVFRALVRDIAYNIDRSLIAGRFHNTIVEIITRTASHLAAKSGLRGVVLSGGVFRNDYVRKRATAMLEKDGFAVYRNRATDSGDSGIPIGQIAVAAARGICA